jgi:CO dehydrogenase nickel-insertion accessory protein CooC1
MEHGARSTRSTEHGAHGVRSSRKTKILYNKIHCLLFQIFVIINKVFSRFTRWGSKKIGLLKNTYAKLPKAIVKIGL